MPEETRKDLIQTRSRNYDQIETDVLKTLPILAPNWTVHSSDEPGKAILDILIGLSDALHFNIDKANLENTLETAVLEQSGRRLAHLLHYRPKRWIAAQGEIVVTIGEIPYFASTEEINLPALTTISGKNKSFVLAENFSIGENFSGQREINAYEGVYKSFTVNLNDFNLLRVELPKEKIAEQLFEVLVNDEVWFDATDHPLDSSLDNFYYLDFVEDVYYIVFRASRGRIPKVGDKVTVNYLSTSGENVLPQNLDVPVGAEMKYEEEGVVINYTWNSTEFTGAQKPETLTEIKDRAPSNMSTRGRAVTAEDYEDLAKKIPGVKNVYVRKNKRGWNTVEIYVASTDGETPSVGPLEAVKNYFELRNTLVSTVRTYPATLRRFVLSVSFKPKNGVSGTRILTTVKNSLEESFSYKNSNFSKPVRISDIYGILEDIPGVDYSNINALHWLDSQPIVKNLIPADNEYPILLTPTIILE